MLLPTNLKEDTMVDVVFRGSHVRRCNKPADYWNWRHSYVPGDIVKYRIHGTDKWYRWDPFVLSYETTDSIHVLDPEELPI